MSGDVSGWVWPAVLVYMRNYSNLTSYGASGFFTGVKGKVREIRMDGNSLDSAAVDRILVDCNTSGVYRGIAAASFEVLAANGQYDYAGMVNARPSYAKLTRVMSWDSGTSHWEIRLAGDLEYYSVEDVATPNLIVNWNKADTTASAGETPLGNTIVLNVAGNNAAPGAAGIAAHDALVVKDWTVTKTL